MHSLSAELLYHIYSFIPLVDKIVILPKISRIWRSITDEMVPAKTFLKSNGVYYNEADLEMIRKIAFKINFISSMKATTYKFKSSSFNTDLEAKAQFLNKQTFYLNYNNTKNLAQLSLLMDYRFYLEFSPIVNITWNPETMKIIIANGKWRDYRASYRMKFNIRQLSYQKEMLSNDFIWSFCRERIIKKRGLFSWKGIQIAESPPWNMESIIWEAINLESKVYILYLVHLNLIAIAKTSINEIEGKGLSFGCNKNGRILESNKNLELNPNAVDQSISLILKVKTKQVSYAIVKALIWESNDSTILGTQEWRIADFMRWSVFSVTAEKLAQQLNLEICHLHCMKEKVKQNFFIELSK